MDFKSPLWGQCFTGDYGYESAHQINHTKFLPHPTFFPHKYIMHKSHSSKTSRYYFCLNEDVYYFLHIENCVCVGHYRVAKVWVDSSSEQV
jgi:hypothetical protein